VFIDGLILVSKSSAYLQLEVKGRIYLFFVLFVQEEIGNGFDDLSMI